MKETIILEDYNEIKKYKGLTQRFNEYLEEEKEMIKWTTKLSYFWWGFIIGFILGLFASIIYFSL